MIGIKDGNRETSVYSVCDSYPSVAVVQELASDDPEVRVLKL